MSKSSLGRVSRWIAGTILVAAFASVVPASITDDITPFESMVQVGLWNPSTNVSTGLLVVTVVQANGQTVTHSAPFRLEPGASKSVVVVFAEPVSSVEDVSIIE